MITATAYDIHVDKLFDRMKRLNAALVSAEIPYRIVGGMAAFLQVSERDPGKARLTRDIDVAVHRDHLDRIMAAAEKFGFQYRRIAGVDMLLDRFDVEHAEPRASSGIHMVFVPRFSEPTRTKEGILIAPVEDLVRMKLTNFRLKDKVHIQDLDSVGLITDEIEKRLSEDFRKRLQEVRASE